MVITGYGYQAHALLFGHVNGQCNRLQLAKKIISIRFRIPYHFTI